MESFDWPLNTLVADRENHCIHENAMCVMSHSQSIMVLIQRFLVYRGIWKLIRS